MITLLVQIEQVEGGIRFVVARAEPKHGSPTQIELDLANTLGEIVSKIISNAAEAEPSARVDVYEGPHPTKRVDAA